MKRLIYPLLHLFQHKQKHKGLLQSLLLALLLLALYPAATWLALNCYQDDPASMNWSDREAFNRKIIDTLPVDGSLNQTDVQHKLGGPDISEAKQQNNQLLQLAYYRTHRAFSDGLTTKNECTALLYLDRHLLAKGEAAELRYNQP